MQLRTGQFVKESLVEQWEARMFYLLKYILGWAWLVGSGKSIQIEAVKAES